MDWLRWALRRLLDGLSVAIGIAILLGIMIAVGWVLNFGSFSPPPELLPFPTIP